MCRGSLYGSVRRLCLMLLTALVATPTSANDLLYQQAQDYLRRQLAPLLQPGDRIDIEVRTIDSRLQLPACAFPLVFEHPRAIEPGAFSVKTECAGPKRWSVYLNGNVEIFRPVVVSARPIGRDTRLTSTLLTLAERPLSQLHHGYYTDPSLLTDHISRRNLPAQQVLQPRHLSPPLLVREGDDVVIQAGGSLLSVETRGIALEDGRLDQQIRVKNSRSERVIRARVAARGRVVTR
ncbi:flagellar basal body P-ring formation chaperone FlgA [Motiliproteus sediminis]|uniref:flagellar basal body P-ring formation chaperone FlgA n=1 Tax=Motiliproteus sediminis TaxID=1468178 RepID=UPI001AF01998|nr:flagellar basal body P-ring formation chaperone FlgA [Motiliproteus sediminis]